MSELQPCKSVPMGEVFAPTWYQYDLPAKNGVVLLADPEDMHTLVMLSETDRDLDNLPPLEKHSQSNVYADPENSETIYKLFKDTEAGIAVQGTMAHVRAHLDAERGLPQFAPPCMSWSVRMPRLRGAFLPNVVKDNKEAVLLPEGGLDFHAVWAEERVKGKLPFDLGLPAWRSMPTARSYRQLFTALGSYYGGGRAYETSLVADLAKDATRATFVESMPHWFTKGSLVIANGISDGWRL